MNNIRPVIGAWHEAFSQDNERLVVPAIRAKLEDLVQGHVRHPHVVLRVHRDHVRQEEQVLDTE